jgi:hypothetical protein
LADDPIYFRLVPVNEAPEGDFVLSTQAFIDCGLCGETISTTDGPAPDAVCMRCAAALTDGHMRGLIEWADEDEDDAEPGG